MHFSTLHVTSTSSYEPFSPPPGERALVLGGGGSSGNAWLIGVVAGLLDAGLDVTDPDLVIGTSAGSTAAAQVRSATSPSELFAAILAATPPPRPAGARGPGPVGSHLDRLAAIIATADGPTDLRRRVGEATLPGDTDDGAQDRWRATVAGRLPSQDWPERPVLVTAVDARTGAGVVFDRTSGVALADAVAASCSNGFGVPPYVIGGNAYLDGGYRRNENADLATGFGRVLVLSPFGGRSLHPLESGMQLAAQVDELRAGGSRVETVFPGSNPGDIFGPNAMDPASRPIAAQLGYDQGLALADRLGDFWG